MLLSEIAGTGSQAAQRRFDLLYSAWVNMLPFTELDRPNDPDVADLDGLAAAVRQEGDRWEQRQFGSNSPWRTSYGTQTRMVRKWPPKTVREVLARLEPHLSDPDR